MTMVIEGLDSSVNLMVSQYRQDNGDVSFLGLVNYAKAHGSASRAKDKKTKKVTIQAPATLRVGCKTMASTQFGKITPQFIWQIQFNGQRDVVRKGATRVIMKELLSLKAILLSHRRAMGRGIMKIVERQLYGRSCMRRSRMKKTRVPF